MKINLLTCIILLFQLAGYAQTNNKTIDISEDVKLIKLSDKAYIHVSYSEFETYGKVSGNGLLLVDNGEAFLFDSPWSNEQTETLVNWVNDSLHAKVTTFVPNHWHEDCMGGLEYLHKCGVKSYANKKTIAIAKEKGLPVPQKGFTNSLPLKLNNIRVYCYYLCRGHATDNIVVWVPSEKILFAGCMVKDMQSKGLGNLSDASIEEWPKTIDKLIAKFPSAEIVIPGHGLSGGKELLIHTKQLLSK